MLLSDKKILASSEKTCEECGKQFTVINADLWSYKFLSKGGHKSYFCRYNCCRAGEKKRDEQIKINRSKKGRKIEVKANKPKKGVLEIDLKSGIPIVQIAKKYEASVQTIHNWIKSYGLKGQKEPVTELKKAYEKPILEEVVQVHPEVEIQIMPEVEIYESIRSGVEDIPEEEFAAHVIELEKEWIKPIPTIEEKWDQVENILIDLHAMYVEKAERDFKERISRTMVGELA